MRARLAELDTASKAWANERAFLGAGLVDPEAQDIARVYHERIPEAERPALGDWLAGIKADPAKAPKGLAPFLGTVAQPAAVVAPPPVAPGSLRPPAPSRVETTPAAGVAISAEAIRAAYQQAMRTGDWAPYDGLKSQLDAERAQAR